MHKCCFRSSNPCLYPDWRTVSASVRSPEELRSLYAHVKSKNGGRWFDLEPVIQSVYEQVLNHGDSAIDAGAHKGLHTFPMAHRVGPQGSVVAIEAIPKLAWLLQSVIDARELTQVRVVQVALSDFQGAADFLLASDPAYSGLQRRVYPPEVATRTIRVSVDTLDSICQDAARLRFIKLDLEGGEFDAMRGGLGLIRKHRPALVFEYDCHRTPAFYGFRHEDVLKFFEDLDYDLFDVLGVPFDRPDLWNSAKLWYYFAIPREQRPYTSIIGAIEAATRQYLS